MASMRIAQGLSRPVRRTRRHPGEYVRGLSVSRARRSYEDTIANLRLDETSRVIYQGRASCASPAPFARRPEMRVCVCELTVIL